VKVEDRKKQMGGATTIPIQQWSCPAGCFLIGPVWQQEVNKEVMTMKPWIKWQDWSTLVLGAILFVAPFGFAAANTPQCSLGNTAWFSAPSALDAWIAGIALIAVSLWALARPGTVVTEWVRIVLGVWLFFVPWILGFVAGGAVAWTAWIIGILTVALALWKLLEVRSSQTKAPSF